MVFSNIHCAFQNFDLSNYEDISFQYVSLCIRNLSCFDINLLKSFGYSLSGEFLNLLQAIGSSFFKTKVLISYVEQEQLNAD